MAKERIKKEHGKKQGGLCCFCREPIDPDNYLLLDTDRIVQKVEGGTYDDFENVRVAHPRCHMERHGNLRLRSKELTELKSMVDDREQIMKLRNKIANQLRAYERKTDELLGTTKEFLKTQLDMIEFELNTRTRLVVKTVNKLAKSDDLIASALGVMGIGEITIAYLTVYIDLAKARHCSSLWKYAGLHKASHERYKKDEDDDGKNGWGGNKSLRTVLYTTASSIEKNRKSPYRMIYERTKSRLAISDKIVKSRNTQGKLIECMWKDTKPCHRQGAALRAIMKHVLADYWYVGRMLNGLPTNPTYAEAMLGKGGHKTIDAERRGWVVS